MFLSGFLIYICKIHKIRLLVVMNNNLFYSQLWFKQGSHLALFGKNVHA